MHKISCNHSCGRRQVHEDLLHSNTFLCHLLRHARQGGISVDGTLEDSFQGIVSGLLRFEMTPTAACWVNGVPSITTLGLFSCTCLHTTSDNNQTRPKHTTQRPNKHHHHGGGVANPSGGVDLMNPRRLRGGRPCA